MARAVFVEMDESVSTNDDARELAFAGAPHGTLVLAATQRAGRGRDGRSFTSPRGGLYMSVVIRPRAPSDQWSAIPLLAGAAAAIELRERGFPTELKWPNDLLLAGRKVGGILVESRGGPDAFAIVGIGVNVRAAPEGVPTATWLAQHGHAPAVRELAVGVRDALLARVARLDTEGPARVMSEVRALCATLGRQVGWEEGEGVAIDVANDGALVVEKEDGVIAHVRQGDVRVKQR